VLVLVFGRRCKVAKKTTVSTGEWAKHLRPFGKRLFWKKDRKAAKKIDSDKN
jgi:hypothetical protein